MSTRASNTKSFIVSSVFDIEPEKKVQVLYSTMPKIVWPKF